MKGPMAGPNGGDLPPTGKSFEVDFCTVARWSDDGEIIEENLFYDLIGLMHQVGIG
jgi:hypothetical protein